MEYLEFYGQKPIDVVFVSSQIRQGFFRFNIRFFYAFYMGGKNSSTGKHKLLNTLQGSSSVEPSHSLSGMQKS